MDVHQLNEILDRGDNERVITMIHDNFDDVGENLPRVGRYFGKQGIKLRDVILDNVSNSVKEYIELGDMVFWINPSYLNKDGNTNLMISVSHNDTNYINYFKQRKLPNINFQNDEGRTALFYTLDEEKTLDESYDLISFLLGKGTDPTLIDHYGNTAIDYMKRKKEEKINHLMRSFYRTPDLSFYFNNLITIDEYIGKHQHQRILNYLDLFDRYPEKSDLLGVGRSGTVVKVTDKKGSQFALKMMIYENEFRDERNVMTQVAKYPNCVNDLACMYDSFILTIPKENRLPSLINVDHLFCIMYQMIYGPSLREVQFTFDEWKIFAFWLINTVESLHARKIYHRDLRLFNIIKTIHQYILIDFGESCVDDMCNPDRDFEYRNYSSLMSYHQYLALRDVDNLIMVLRDTSNSFVHEHIDSYFKHIAANRFITGKLTIPSLSDLKTYILSI